MASPIQDKSWWGDTSVKLFFIIGKIIRNLINLLAGAFVRHYLRNTRTEF